MYSATETIVVQRGTFGTSLEFRLYSGETQEDLPASAYDKIVLRAYSYPSGEEHFSGEVDETLATTTTNEVNYTFVEQNTLKKGVFSLKLELLNLSGETIVSKEVVDVGNLKIEG